MYLALLLGALMTLASCSHLFFYPDSRTHYPALRSQNPPQVIRFASLDGTTLDSWFFQNDPALGTVVQFHGNAQNISSHFLSLVWLREEGFNFFTFDYRGYGQSEGRPDIPGVTEDGVAALIQGLELHQKHSPDGLFVVIGQSLGGAIALRALELRPDLAQQVDLIVMDSSFASYQEVAASALRSTWVTWLFSPLAYILISDRHSEKNFLENTTTPILVIHDRNDPVVSFKLGEQIYSRAKNPIGLWAPEDGQHIGAFIDSTSPFREKLLDLLNELARTTKANPHPDHLPGQISPPLHPPSSKD